MGEIFETAFYLLGSICFACGIGLFIAIICIPNKKDKKKEDKEKEE